MTLQVFPSVEQRSEEWYAQRRGIVTASVAGSLISVSRKTAIDFDCPACGAVALEPCRSKRSDTAIKTLHPERAEVAKRDRSIIIEPASNDTSRDLTMHLAAERITGYTEPTFQSDDMWRGIEDEPRARDFYAEHYAPVEQVGFMVRTTPSGYKVGYSPDGLVGDDGLIEIKSRRQKNQLKTVLAGTVPSENMAQIQCGLLVSGRQWADYVSWSGGMKFWTKRVYPQRDWFIAIVKAVSRFESNVVEMMRLYDEQTEGLPLTERPVELEIV